MNKKIRIVVLTEDYLLKESLVNKINSNSDYEIIGIFDDGIKCLKYLINHESDLFVIDFMLTNIDAVGLITQLKKSNVIGSRMRVLKDFYSFLLPKY